MFDPIRHSELCTGRAQSTLLDAWADSGVAVSKSTVVGSHHYHYRAVPFPVVAVTLYRVKRHVLSVDGRVCRDKGVLPGRFRIGEAGQDITVDADPGRLADSQQRRLMLIYINNRLANAAGMLSSQSSGPQLQCDPWEVDDPFLVNLLLRLDEIADDERQDRLLADQIGLTLGLHLVNRYSIGQQNSAKSTGRPARCKLSPQELATVLDFIRCNLSGSCSLAALSKLTSRSPSHFLRHFHATLGTTPYQFILKERVSLAQDELLNTKAAIAEIAISCGFSSQSHFTTIFKRSTGTTPGRYRSLFG